MTTRAAFIALGVTVAIMPIAARAAPAASGIAASPDAGARGFDLDAGSGVAFRPDIPLPPGRPDIPGRPDGPGPAADRADPISAPDAAGRVVTMVLPPLRPSVGRSGDGPAAQPRVGVSPVPPPRPEEIIPAVADVEIDLLPPARPAFSSDPEPVETGSIGAPGPVRSLFGSLFAPVASAMRPAPAAAVARSGHDGIDDLIARHARRNDVPEDLVHRIVTRESRYDPRAVGRGGALGLMQIKHATARALGYDGPPSGLLDPDTNLAYGVRYLAGAYRTARGDYNRAVSYYAHGYYYAAKRLRRDQAEGRPAGREAASTRVRRAAALAVADNARIERLPDVR